MRRYALWPLAVLALTACQALPIPVDLPLEGIRQGRLQQDFGGLEFGEVRRLRIPPRLFVFDPPRPPLTYGALDTRIRYVLLPDPPSSTRATVRLYLVPPVSGTCPREAVYPEDPEAASRALLAQGYFSGDGQGTPVEAHLQAVLGRAHLDAVNGGRVCLGMELDLSFGRPARAIEVAWEFLHLRIGAGIF